MKIRKVNMIEVGDWDDLVIKTYGRPYNFQQQDGCKQRGTHEITVPGELFDEDWPDTIPEIVNGEEMGVNFKSWLARDPRQPLEEDKNKDPNAPYSMVNFHIDLWWERNFYPDVQDVANDLHKKDLLDAGEYVININ